MVAPSAHSKDTQLFKKWNKLAINFPSTYNMSRQTECERTKLEGSYILAKKEKKSQTSFKWKPVVKSLILCSMHSPPSPLCSF